jgi:23S rRNA (cytosine1962-C5)-methyltransferase
LRSGHPWLFADSIREQNREGKIGELAVIYDRRDQFLGAGLFDPSSPIRVRMLHVGKPATIDRRWWAARLEEALVRRGGLFDAETTGFRLINGESDGWPGLVLDRYDTTLVLKLYTAAWLPRLEEILGLIRESLQPERIVLRFSRNIQAVAVSEFSRTDGEILHGPPLEGPVIFLESGLRFEANVARGQKTGFFLDQRENRRRVRALAGEQTVLNAFSFTGGFSLYAAAGGAKSVTDLDISAHALAGAKQNFALNQTRTNVAACRHETIQTDAFDWLSGNSKRKFDLIVLDPPSFAKRESERARAVAAYTRLASLGIQHLARSGALVACSCSAHVSSEEFFAALRKAATASKREFEELETARHAPDHPATFKEAEYLKAIYFRFLV